MHGVGHASLSVKHATYPELREDALVKWHLSDATAVAVCQRLGCAVAASHADSLGEDLLQFGRRSAGDERSYQRQRVVVEVRLQRINHQPALVAAAAWRVKTHPPP